jgi:hypothetical protein
MNYLKRSFIFGIAIFMAAILGAPALGGQLQAASQPKYTDKEVAQVQVRFGPGWRGRGYYRSPRYRVYQPGYRVYSPAYRYHYYSPRYYRPGTQIYFRW